MNKYLEKLAGRRKGLGERMGEDVPRGAIAGAVTGGLIAPGYAAYQAGANATKAGLNKKITTQLAGSAFKSKAKQLIIPGIVLGGLAGAANAVYKYAK